MKYGNTSVRIRLEIAWRYQPSSPQCPTKKNPDAKKKNGTAALQTCVANRCNHHPLDPWAATPPACKTTTINAATTLMFASLWLSSALTRIGRSVKRLLHNVGDILPRLGQDPPKILAQHTDHHHLHSAHKQDQ